MIENRGIAPSTLGTAPVHLSSSEQEVLKFLLAMSEDYPGIEHWYRLKVIPGLRTGSRHVLRVRRHGRLVGVGIGKREEENKICTVRVLPGYFGRGLGIRIFDGLLRWLEDAHPHFTISERKLPAFERIFDYYGFRITSQHPNLYVPQVTEFGYNGILL